MRWLNINELKSREYFAKSHQAAFLFAYFFFHKSWKAFISRFTAFANSVKSFASFIKTRTRQSKRLTKAMTVPSKATIKQSVLPFSKNQGNRCYTIGIISSNKYLSKLALFSTRVRKVLIFTSKYLLFFYKQCTIVIVS